MTAMSLLSPIKLKQLAGTALDQLPADADLSSIDTATLERVTGKKLEQSLSMPRKRGNPRQASPVLTDAYPVDGGKAQAPDSDPDL